MTVGPSSPQFFLLTFPIPRKKIRAFLNLSHLSSHPFTLQFHHFLFTNSLSLSCWSLICASSSGHLSHPSTSSPNSNYGALSLSPFDFSSSSYVLSMMRASGDDCFYSGKTETGPRPTEFQWDRNRRFLPFSVRPKLLVRSKKIPCGPSVFKTQLNKSSQAQINTWYAYYWAS